MTGEELAQGFQVMARDARAFLVKTPIAGADAQCMVEVIAMLRLIEDGTCVVTQAAPVATEQMDAQGDDTAE